MRAGEVLDSALGVDERLDRFARLLVPQLADFVKIELLEGKGGRRPVAIAHQDPEREALMRAWRDRGTLGESERVGMAHDDRHRRGQAHRRDRPEDAVVRSAREPTGEEGAQLMQAIGPRSQIVVPLRARGRVLGALSLTMAESGRHYDEADLDLARDLGLRAGLAVDNARLYEEAQAPAVAEQRRAGQLDALAAASLAIHRTRSLERRLELIADRARELIGARRATASVLLGRGGRAEAPARRRGRAGEPELSVPLVARDGTRLRRGSSVAGKIDGAFAPADEHVLEDLARIASLAIENARLEERERHIARTLQASLLPLDAAGDRGARGRPRATWPAARARSVGGDLYDLFPVEDEWALVVGDVCGKGAEAAALTAMVRYTMRAEAVHRVEPVRGAAAAQRRDPAPVQRRALLHGPARPRARRRRRGAAAARARGPPAAARAARRRHGGAGPVRRAAARRRPATSSHADVSVTLGPGDALVCFTDGVTEGRGPAGCSATGRCGEVLAACAGLDADAIAEP